MTNADADYQRRMLKKSNYINERIEKANIDRGVIVLLTGNGKGKSSSAFGMVCRSLGHNKHVAIAKFLKGEIASGEDVFLQQQKNVSIVGVKTDFTWETKNRSLDIKIAEATWNQILPSLQNPKFDLVVLDELTYMINYGYLVATEIIKALHNRPQLQHVIITGRAASKELLKVADTVSEIKNIKHAFMNNIKAQIGIEL